MRRIKLVVSYDGTAYCGWQLQPNGVTIEEVLNKALSSLLKEDIQVIGASRIPESTPWEMWQFLIQKAGFQGIRSVLH